MAWDSDTARSPSSITGTRPCGFNALIESAKVAAGGDVLMGKTELADEPKHFLHIEGAAASPNFEHRRFLLMATAVTPLRLFAVRRGSMDMTMPSTAPMASSLQPRRHVLVLALKLHAGRERHRLHQCRKVLLQIFVRIAFERGGAEMALQHLARRRRHRHGHVPFAA